MSIESYVDITVVDLLKLRPTFVSFTWLYGELHKAANSLGAKDVTKILDWEM